MLHSKIFFKTHIHACPHMHVYMSFSKVSYRMSHKNITQYHCSNACLGIIIVLLYPITYFQMAPCSAVHQREKSAGWGRQNKPGDGSILWVLLAGQVGWSSGMRPSRHAILTEVMNREKQGRQNREKTGNRGGD